MNIKSKGSITISRPRGGSEPQYVEIRIRDEMSGVHFLEAQIELANFTDALMGLAEVDCTFEHRPKYVGMKYEHKYEEVKSDWNYSSDRNKRREIARKACKKLEVDGWQARVDDLFNQHNRTKDGYRVLFTRYVEPDSLQPQE